VAARTREPDVVSIRVSGAAKDTMCLSAPSDAAKAVDMLQEMLPKATEDTKTQYARQFCLVRLFWLVVFIAMVYYGYKYLKGADEQPEA